MPSFSVSIVNYESPLASVRKAVELCGGLDGLPDRARVMIKPNIVFWTRFVDFPKWGVITTSRVVEDVIILLKEKGVRDIVIGEGTVFMDPTDRETPQHAFRSLGYDVLKKKYGVRYMSFWDRPFQKMDFGDGIRLNVNADILESDFVVNLPVMKTHNQTIVSLGIKNLKGTIDMGSRKKCHCEGKKMNLHNMVSRLADVMPPMLTLIDGIFTNERGPSFDGRIRRSNLLVASSDILSADMTGARLLGYCPSEIPHLVHAASHRGRSLDFLDIDLKGIDMDQAASRHEYDFIYTDDPMNRLPLPLAKMGIKGVSYPKYDLSMCTYCSGVNGLVLSAIRYAWKGQPWDGVEILTGKTMKPTPGMKKTILLGKCMYKANRDNSDIQEMIAVKGCPPKPLDIVNALHQAGIDVDPGLFENIDSLPAFFLGRYADKPEFDPLLFQIQHD
ncbi:MAG: DUF362 domain-containing protein [Desulfatirhabdiaceae bacterium]